MGSFQQLLSTGYGFTFPLALTCCHMGFIFLALIPHMLSDTMRGTHRKSIEKQWKGLIAIGVLMAANIAFNNSSLVNISLSLSQIIRYALITASVPAACHLTTGLFELWRSTRKGGPRLGVQSICTHLHQIFNQSTLCCAGLQYQW